MDGRKSKSWLTRRIEHTLDMPNRWSACARPDDAAEERHHAWMQTAKQKHAVVCLPGGVRDTVLFFLFFFPFFFFFLIFFSCHPSFLVDGSVVNMPLALSSALQPECRPLHVGWLAKPYPQYFWR